MPELDLDTERRAIDARRRQSAWLNCHGLWGSPRRVIAPGVGNRDRVRVSDECC